MCQFCSVKDYVKEIKRKAIEWEKILVNHISDKAIVCKIYKEILKQANENKQPSLKTEQII